MVSVLWVFVGTGWVTSSLTCQTTAPALWWLVFTVSMFYWVHTSICVCLGGEVHPSIHVSCVQVFLSVFVIAILVFTVVNMLAGTEERSK